jgi:alpha-ketoglutarate-dependent taurine dioxygenase
MEISIGSARNRTAVAANTDLVRLTYFDQARLPAVIEPAIAGVDLVRWGGTQQQRVDSILADAGAILFRNFGISKVEQFEAFVKATCGPLLDYKERSSPRSRVSGNIFTSTDYPPSRAIFLHTEQSYNYTFPRRIAFFCLTEPAEGGETPIADTRRVLQRIQPRVRRRFEEQGYLYVRNFGGGAGLSWQEAFQTKDPQKVEEHCRKSVIEFEWISDGRLRTRQRRPAVARHPSGVDAWFNHITFFHISTLEPDIRQQMLEYFSEADLPNNTYYGDGSPIEPEVMEELRKAYLEESTSFKWRAGDILLLDNVLTAHGRSPFTPPRSIVVSMAQPWSWSEAGCMPS